MLLCPTGHQSSARVLWPLLPWVTEIPPPLLSLHRLAEAGGRASPDTSRGQTQNVKLGLLFKMDKLHFFFLKYAAWNLTISLGSILGTCLISEANDLY